MRKSKTKTEISRRIKHLLYWNSVVLLSFITALEVVFYNETTVSWYLYAASAVVVTLGVFAWLFWDSKERNIELTLGFCVFTIIMGPVMLPTYYIRTRGFKDSMKLLLGLALYVPYYIVHYGVWYTTATLINDAVR